MKLKDLFTPSIRRRITVAFLIVTMLVMAMAVVSYLQLRQVQPYSDTIIRDSAKLAAYQEIAQSLSNVDTNLERYLVIRGAEYKEAVESNLQGMSDTLAFLQEGDNLTEEDPVLLEELGNTIDQLESDVQVILELQPDASSREINEYIFVVYDEIEKAKQLQEELTTLTSEELENTAQTQSQIASNVVIQSVIFGIIVVLFTIITAVTTDRRLLAINTLTNTVTAIAEGDLTRVAPVERKDEIGTLAVAFNSMTQQLRETLESQEQRIAERTRALETSTEVGRRLSTILDQRELVREVVNQIRTAFNYYHSQIYLFDKKKENLTMVGGTGKAGQIMLERGHSIPIGRGLVGRAANSNLPVLVPDVERSIGYEIITADTVQEVFERESSLASTKTWYANHISSSFTNLKAFAERVAKKKAAGEQLPRLGYVLYGVNDFLGTVKMGAEEAAQTLGLEVEIVSADFDPNQGIRLFDEMVKKKYDGLIVQPDNPEAWIAPIQEAVKAGIPIVTTNLRFPGSAISAWFGQDSYQSGIMLGRNLQQALAAVGKTSGEIVVASAREISELHERYAGLTRSLQETEYTLSEFYDAPLNEQLNIAAWEKLIQSHPDMIAAVGLASVDLPSMIRLKKRFNAQWVAAGYDLTVEVLEAIQDGTAQIAIGQHPYMQGYLPVLALAQHYIDGTPLEGWIVDGWQSNPLLPETRAEIAVPISVGENVVGVLDVQDQHSYGLDETDAELLQSIATQVAQALQNAQAYQKAQQQVAREALIANINQQIQSTNDVEDALQVAVRELGRALGTDASIRLMQKSNGNPKN